MLLQLQRGKKEDLWGRKNYEKEETLKRQKYWEEIQKMWKRKRNEKEEILKKGKQEEIGKGRNRKRKKH